MNSSSKVRGHGDGPEPGDCFRLMRSIQRGWVPDARVEISWYEFGDKLYGMKAELISDSAVVIDGCNYLNIWSTKTFGNQLHLISSGQLYDLLIVGYRAIEKYFEEGEAFAPARRVR
jgi:hypothetical protein